MKTTGHSWGTVLGWSLSGMKQLSWLVENPRVLAIRSKVEGARVVYV